MKRKILFLALFGLLFGEKIFANPCINGDVKFNIYGATCSGSVCFHFSGGHYCCYCYGTGNSTFCIDGTSNCGGDQCNALTPSDFLTTILVEIVGCGNVHDYYNLTYNGTNWSISTVYSGSSLFGGVLNIPDIGLFVDSDGTSLGVSAPSCGCTTDNDGNGVNFF